MQGDAVSQLAYLVIREGSKWSDVFRLVPGQSVTIGRAPTSQIVLKDERCSRNHAEVFMSSGQWMLRDLDSRNGTMVGTELVRGDWLLKPGDIVRIGHTQLVFVHKLSDAFISSGDGSSVIRRLSPESAADAADDDANVLAACEPTTITHRRGKTKLLAPGRRGGERRLEDRPRGGEALPLGLRVGQGARRGRDGRAGAGRPGRGDAKRRRALLLLSANAQGEPRGEDLEIVASRSSSSHHYHRVSNFLATTVMREGEAVLARNVIDDSTLGHPRQPRRNPRHQRHLRRCAAATRCSA